MRLGCVLVSLALLTSLILQPPKARAFALTSGAISALAGGFLSACGMTPVVSGMGSSEQANEALGRMIQDFLDEKHPGVKDAVEWVGAGVLTVTGAGKVMIPKSMAEKLGQFAAWVASKFGKESGVTQVYAKSSTFVTLADGSKFNLCSGYDKSAEKFLYAGDSVNLTDFPLTFSTGYYMGLETWSNGIDSTLYFYKPSGESVVSISIIINRDTGLPYRPLPFFMGATATTFYLLNYSLSTKSSSREASVPLSNFDIGVPQTIDESLSLDVAESMQEILERLTALEEGQSIALDVGATQSMEIQDILQGILDAILAGDLTATAEVVDTTEQPVDPEEPTIPVVPKGLDELGAALTSRFPFSIPWDVYKGVQLLAAPAQAPYFEVDFLAPIGHLVGGWKGSTKIVLDMSEYEIIGQVSRWTSTIGFCLMLASGTKRLIWTA